MLLCIAIIVAGCSASHSPKRPPTVPLEASWIGGVDGGVWVSCDRATANILKCRVFSEDGGGVLQAGEYQSRQALKLSDLNAFNGRTLLTESEELSFTPATVEH